MEYAAVMEEVALLAERGAEAGVVARVAAAKLAAVATSVDLADWVVAAQGVGAVVQESLGLCSWGQ